MHTCDELNGKTIILVMGLPRSGKTTWARSTAHPIVNPDSIRLAMHGQRFIAQAEPWVWAMAFAMTEALLRAGHSAVVVDATNGTAARRQQWIDRFKGCSFQFHPIDTPKEECIRRALATGDTEIVPVIERMAAEWEPLRYSGIVDPVSFDHSRT